MKKLVTLGLMLLLCSVVVLAGKGNKQVPPGKELMPCPVGNNLYGMQVKRTTVYYAFFDTEETYLGYEKYIDGELVKDYFDGVCFEGG